MAIIVKNGKQVQNYLRVNLEDESSLQDKVSWLSSRGYLMPLKSWPTSKEMLLNVINNYLSLLELGKLSNMVDDSDEEEKGIFESDDEEKYEDQVEERQEETGETTDESTDNSEDEMFVGEDEYIELPDSIYDIDNCSEKALANIVRILNVRSKAIRKIRLMRQARLENEKINTEVEKVAIYNIVLAKFLPILNKQEIVDKVNIKTATRIFEDVCVEGYQELPTQAGIESEIKKNKEDQDFDIVSALNYAGVSVDRDDYGFYSIKNYNNGRGIKYFIGKAEKSFAMSKTSAQRFIDEFLNKPIEKRKFMTPGQVFITYINEAEKSLGINSRSSGELSGLFGSMNSSKSAKQYFKDIIKKYSRNSQDWKDFQKLFEGEYYSNKESKDDHNGRMLVRQQAKRLVIGEVFEDLVNYGDILSNEQISINDYRISDISRDFGLEFDLENFDVDRTRIENLQDQTFRIVNSMHTILQQMRAFIQDIIDNYTVDYLRKEKIFLLQQEDQNEFISKKKEYEGLIKKLSYDKDKDSNTKIAYYQSQIDELTQKIGNKDYVEAKNVLLKSKNNFRILLLNAKSQKEKVVLAINDAKDNAKREYKPFTIDDTLEIIREVLTVAPELVVTFDKGRATSWIKHKMGEQAEKKQEPLSEVDKIIEYTAAKISDESHQKILQENLIREKMKKTQKEERVKSVNAYINAYGSIVGNAMGVGAFTGMPSTTVDPGPTFAPQIAGMGGVLQNNNIATPRNIARLNSPAPMFGEGMSQPIPTGTIDPMTDYTEMPTRRLKSAGVYTPAPTVVSAPAQTQTIVSSPVQPTTYVAAPAVQAAPVQVVPVQTAPVQPVYSAPVYPQPMAEPAAMQHGPANYPKDYQDFDFMSENVEPCVIPYIVAYEGKGGTTYGIMLERYATMDRYKYLLSTNNNALYTYIETKQSQIQTSEQIISDMHIRYLKNAMAKSGFSTQDSNLATFDYKADTRRFLSQYVPQNIIEMVLSDYNEMIDTIDFELLKDLIEHKFKGELEDYIPENIKNDVMKAANMIASVVKAIMTDPQVQKTYDAYSSKMKQTYISSLMSKIDSNSISSVKLNPEEAYSRIIDYLSFSIKAQNVIIQNQDNKDSGLATYPRSIFFKQKDNADQALKKGKVLSFEQNEIITTRTASTLSEMGNDVMNLFGTLYKFNGSYNKLLQKLKPFTLNSGVKFMENLVDALNEKLNMKITVLEEEKKKSVTLVKFASKEKEKQLSNEDKTRNYEDDNWFVRKGFVLDKNRIKEYYTKVAFGFKYALEKDKNQLKQDFYDKDILSLGKINEKFKDFPTHTISMITAVIRDIMMSKCERIIDFIDYVNNHNETHSNKMLYINRMLMESKTFDKKNPEEKLETLIALDEDFMKKADDMVNPHPEIYPTTIELEKFEGLYLYYALTDLFEKLGSDERFITKELTEYFEDLKKKFRNNLLAMIRDGISMNGYEQDLAKHFELKSDNMKDLELIEEEQVEEEETKKEIAKIKNIDVIFKGILDGFNKALEEEQSPYVQEQMLDVKEILEMIGTLPGINSEEKELEIALPNNQAIRCNIKGFLQQYLFRYIVDKEHELGPFAYVVGELVQHEEIADSVKNIEIVANKLNAPELGINLIAKFSSINLSNDGNVLKIGDNISTVIETINRLKTPTDQQKALNRDVFYKEGVNGVRELFAQYFARVRVENIE